MKAKLLVLTLAGVMAVSLAALAYAQEKPEIPVQDVPAAVSPEEENISWVWGEVKSVDPALSTATVIYMDYQTDEEKDLVLEVNAQTKFEGVEDLGALKVGDTAGIDYTIIDGKNIAKNISVEKIEAMPEAVEEPGIEPVAEPAVAQTVQ